MMKTRRMGLITALLLTAALFVYWPGLMRTLVSRDASRADESLRPPKLRTLTVWTVGSAADDRQLIASACAAFEKQHPGTRIFLRSGSAEELRQKDAVLPDAVLFDAGTIPDPQGLFIPLSDASAPSGMYAGSCYAVPLWLSPNVLCFPAQWMEAQPVNTPAPRSLLGVSTPQPTDGEPRVVPWAQIAQSLDRPDGVALQQLLITCPAQYRRQLGGSTAGESRVLSLRAFIRSLADGQKLHGVVLSPAVSDRVRMGALCRDTEEGAAFLRFVHTQCAQQAAQSGLVCPGQTADAPDAYTQEAIRLFASVHTLPNAFAHTREELRQRCLQAFLRMDDPVQTLLTLR